MFEHPFLEWSFAWNGFGIGSSIDVLNYSKNTLYVAPYWSLVTTLTLLSAWLLLSKPRNKSKRTIKPANDSVNILSPEEKH